MSTKHKSTSSICTLHRGSSHLLWPLLLATAMAVPGWAQAAAPSAQGFDSPEGAVVALVEAVRAHDEPQLRRILGAASGRLLHSGEAVEDARGRQKFIDAYDEAHSLVVLGGDGHRAELEVGRAAWPLPIPLLLEGDGRWHFNAASGAAEILARRMGQNELSAIQACLAILDAEHEYAFRHTGADGMGEYAQRFHSSPGTHDGLYWPSRASPTKAGEGGDKAGTDEVGTSPLGPLLSAATRQGYTAAGLGRRVPYQGYFYKILTGQGASAPGGAYDYFVKGRFIGGVAVMAYPAHYRVSGRKSFIVNQNRIVYEKDLGRHTAFLAKATRLFNPDPSWQEVPNTPESPVSKPAP